ASLPETKSGGTESYRFKQNSSRSSHGLLGQAYFCPSTGPHQGARAKLGRMRRMASGDSRASDCNLKSNLLHFIFA
ncbi:MAG: hypothetical protein ACREDM_15945, partial [Methylocella sp.]